MMKMSDIVESEPPLLSILPPSAQKIFKIIQMEKQMYASEIKARTNYSSRTVQSALRQLKKTRLIEQAPNMLDMRRHVYKIGEI